MDNQEYTTEDEINLRDYIKVLIKRKKIILVIFFICVITAAIMSLRIPRVYQAVASVMIMPSRVQTALSPTQISLDAKKETRTGEYFSQRPSISLSTHKALLKSNVVLEEVIDKLKLTDKSGKALAAGSLSGKLNIEETKETNILQLEAEDNKPKIAKELANTWAQEYIKYSQRLISGEIKGSGDFIADQFEIARQNLTQAEKAVNDFNVKEGLSLMKIELKEKQSKLESSYINIHKLEFQLTEKKELLQKINEDIAAMTKDGVWLGSFNIKSFPRTHFVKRGLSISQHSLRRKTLETKLNLEKTEEKHDNFINNFKIELLRQEVTNLRKTLLNDKSVLAEVTQLSKTTEANLESKGSLDRLKNMQGPISQNLPDSTVWEILSLEERYNFFKTRQQSLESKVKQEEVELKTLEKTLFDYENKLKTLDEDLNRAKANYDFYLGKFKSLENAKNSTELEIVDIKFQLSRLKELVKKIETEVRGLKKEINQKESRLTHLTRQVEIYKRTYDNLSAKIEDARIAKAVELGEVKVISPAIEPKSPIKPNKRQMVAISGIIGLFLGVFVAFFQEFWEKGK